MTIDEALQNIDVVVSNAKMNRQEHDTLRQSIIMVAQRCKKADELEKNIQAMKEVKKEDK